MQAAAIVSGRAPVRRWISLNNISDVYHAPRDAYNHGVHTVFKGISQLVVGPDLEDGNGLHVVADAVFVADGGRVVWVGSRTAFSAGEFPVPDDHQFHELGGRAVIPGLVDCHTHLVYAGDRTRDFEDRCCGVSYEAVAARGGGIQTTVDATRAASSSTLLALAVQRCAQLARHGVTTIEVKSGYGLDLASELKLLEVIEALGDRVPQRIIATCLAAHVVPREFRADRAAYLSMICEELLPIVSARGLAQFIDVYCDSGAFTLAETQRLLETGASHGFGLKVHAGQLSRTGAAALAASMGATSADHLEFISDEDAERLADAGTVAVLLPGAGIFLGGETKPPVEALRRAGARIALSTDLNPGTSPTAHLPLMATLGCAWLGLSPAEAIQAITSNAAAALGLADGSGTLAVGAPADFAVLAWDDWRRLPYEMAAQSIDETWIAGERLATE